MIKTENLKLVQEWDKTFAKSDKVEHSKVTVDLGDVTDFKVARLLDTKNNDLINNGAIADLTFSWKSFQIIQFLFGESRYSLANLHPIQCFHRSRGTDLDHLGGNHVL